MTDNISRAAVDVLRRAQELAQERCPADVKDFGMRHKCPTFAEGTWVAGFIDGYRHAAVDLPPSPVEGEGLREADLFCAGMEWDDDMSLERVCELLEEISRGDCQVFDEGECAMVDVSMDTDDMQLVADHILARIRPALSPQSPTGDGDEPA